MMKQFLKYFFASTLGTVVGFVLIIFLSGLILAGIIGSAIMAGKSDSEVKVKSNSVLVIDLSKTIVERTPENPFENIQIEGLGGSNGLELSDFIMALDAAAKDSNIKGILIRGAYFSGGMATMQTVRDHIVQFKDSSNKFVIAYEEAYTQGAYYVASASDEVYMFQEGALDFRGLRTEIAFLKGTMDKLGIDATIIKGPDNIYKSAVEPFYRENMSEPNKLQIQRIIDNVWGEMLSDIGASRGISVDEFNRIADEMAIKKPEDAKSLGLIDDLVYYDQIQSNLRGKLGIEEDDDIEAISIAKYSKVARRNIKKNDDKSWELKDEVAVIYAIGGINSGEGDEENIGSETLAKAIREARLDEDVKAIVLRVNSPGGSALASDVIWRETVLAGEAKPFVVSFGDVAASGGYYISANADRIFAMPNTITGSIGAFGIIPNLRGFFNDKLGMTFDGVKTNKHADFGSLARDFDEAEISLLNGYLEQIYTEFVQKVADGRGTSYEMIDSIGRGRVWTGGDALENGLVDEIGGLEDAIAYAAEMAELSDYDILELPKKSDPFEKFMKDFGGSMKAQVVEWVLGDEVKWLKKIDEIKKMEGIQSRMLYDIRVY
ncbi:signal peptide peptidase SppA [Salibacteraceae bacterium]|jgi:protease IV|nr:signal peptide peptidase SppA [Salibacteraceae bacterium]HAQ70018.1 signal peptide peptidase SppA [Flavobacteriales bacterium]